jgi:NAD(P)-dependent dehydrogenase (short-subunit alcohol dehydrogenase family)
MSKTVIISGASSGFGARTAREVALAGHRVYAGMRDSDGRNAEAKADALRFAEEHDADLRVVDLDVSQQESVDAAVALVEAENDTIDVVVHNAGHMVLGPVEAFTVDQLAEIYDANVLTTQRLNRAVLPILRRQHSGLLVWVGSTSTRGGTPPYLAPYFAAKAAEDSIAVSTAAETSGWGIDTVIVVPGAFTTGTNHFAHAGSPARQDIADEYTARYGDLGARIGEGLAKITPDTADPEEVARQIARVIDLPAGERPFRVHIDPADDGAERVNELGDRVRREYYERVGMTEFLSPAPQDQTAH